MKAYIASTFSDEEGPMAEEGKTVYIVASKERLLELADYFSAVAEYLNNNDNVPCHMHFRDRSKAWDKENCIDVAIELK